MKKFIAGTLLALLTIAAFPQDDDKGQKKSEEILSLFKEKTESYKTMRAEFTYKMENREEGINESRNGAIWIEGDKYKLNIAGQEVFSDGNTLWTYIRDAEEIQINSVEEDDDALSPGKLLTSYDANYKSKFIKETFQYGTTVNIIELTPLEGKTYSKVRLVIGKDNLQLLESTIFDNNGSTYSYIINKFEHDIPLTGIKFTFDPGDYPGAEVIDMR
ncbi:MAG: outer membrane lipoprotein carrier protein LolA [Bacteroidales bacterium]|nr:outer membrane lipoprotein carrier protein LolA [Bacteroidales bacterium]